MKKFNLGHSDVLKWPMTKEQYDNLGETRLVSPRVGNDHGHKAVSEKQYIEEVEELIPLREQVEKGIWPTEYFEKYLGSGELSEVLSSTLGARLKNPKVAADTVRMDHPFDIWDLVIEPWAKANNIPYREELTHKGDPFVESVLYRAKAHSIIAAALDKAFDVKYALGELRPEEYCDSGIVRFQTPNHPECPAGHGAFSGAGARAFELIYSPTKEQLKQVIFDTKQFAMFRSLSAMHIASSNLLGWKIGYENKV